MLICLPPPFGDSLKELWDRAIEVAGSQQQVAKVAVAQMESLYLLLLSLTSLQ